LVPNRRDHGTVSLQVTAHYDIEKSRLGSFGPKKEGSWDSKFTSDSTV